VALRKRFVTEGPNLCGPGQLGQVSNWQPVLSCRCGPISVAIERVQDPEFSSLQYMDFQQRRTALMTVGCTPVNIHYVNQCRGAARAMEIQRICPSGAEDAAV
jgi:hypothetical protein